jgi:hypothetical protein
MHYSALDQAVPKLLVLIHNGHKLDIMHKKFMIHAVYILLIFK